MSASDAMRAVMVLLMLGSTAAGAEQRWGLTWKAADGCIQAAELAERVERRLGHPVFGTDPDLRIDGYLVAADGTPKNAKWRARLTLVDSHGTVQGSRDVTSAEASCRAIDESLGLVVAVMIDPSAALTPYAAPEQPPPPPSAPVEPVPAPSPSPPPIPRPRGPLPMPWENTPPEKLLLVHGVVYLGYQALDQGVFYSMVHREDLRSSLDTRWGTRLFARIAGFVAITAALGFFGAHALDIDCVRFSGTPSNRGSCLESSDWALWTGIGLAAFGVASLGLGFGLSSHPTDDVEDQQLIDQYNDRTQKKPASTVRVQVAPVRGGWAALLSGPLP